MTVRQLVLAVHNYIMLLRNPCSVVVVGFEENQLTTEETLVSGISVQVVLLENSAERRFTVGVQTVDGTAMGEQV